MKTKLNYIIKVTQIVTFEAEHSFELEKLAMILLKLRNSDSKLIQTMSKVAALNAVGRFSLNIDNILSNEAVIIDNMNQLQIKLESKSLNSLDIINKYAISCYKNKKNNYKNIQVSSRNNCSSIVFALVNNRMRNEMYEIYLKTMKNQNLFLLRFDVDSFLLAYNKKGSQLLESIFSISKFQYKTEMKNIKKMISFSKKNHYIESDEKKILKIPGLSLSC